MTKPTDETKPPLGPILTLKEAAERLRTTRHKVAALARRHGIGSLFGRDLRFTEADVAAILEAAKLPTPSRVIYEPASPSEDEISRKAWAFATRGKRLKPKPKG